MVTRMKAGKEFMSVPEGARVRPALALWPADAAPQGADRNFLAALSGDARLLLFPLADVPTRPNGGLGVTLIALPDKIGLQDVAVTDGKALAIAGERRGKAVQEVLDAAQLKEHLGKRAQRGRVVPVRFKVTGFGKSASTSEKS
jgi:topoisomerase-4 subunit A